MVTLYDFQADRERGLAIAVRRAMHAFFAREMAAANQAAAA